MIKYYLRIVNLLIFTFFIKIIYFILPLTVKAQEIPPNSTTTPTPIPITPSITQTPTPLITITLTPTLTSTLTPFPTIIPNCNNLKLNEIMACPIEDNEWIELSNDDNQTCNLSQWSLSDEIGTLITFDDITIKPNDLYVYEISSNKLNNTGDRIQLLNQNLVIDEFTYKSCTQGTSFIRLNTSWQTTENPTKGETNIKPTPTEEMSPTKTIKPTTSTEQLAISKEKNTPTPKITETKTNYTIIDNEKKITDTKIINTKKNKQAIDKLNENITHLTTRITDQQPKQSEITDPQITDTNECLETNKSLINVIIGGIILISLGAYSLYGQINSEHKALY